MSSSSPTLRIRILLAGLIHAWSVISPPSTTTSWSLGAATTKNQVANRFGAIGGGIQCEKHTKSSALTTRPVSSIVSLTAARCAAANFSGEASTSANAKRTSRLVVSITSEYAGGVSPPGAWVDCAWVGCASLTSAWLNSISVASISEVLSLLSASPAVSA